MDRYACAFDSGGRLKRARKNASEDTHQQWLAKWLDSRPGLHWFHTPNGGARSVVVGRKLKAQGAKAGIPDVIIITPPPKRPTARGVALELKTEKGRVSEHQKRWLAVFAAFGWETYVAHGWIDATDWLIELGY